MRRIPMFYKFLLGCGTLALLLIAGGSYVVHLRTGQMSRSENLEKNLTQYRLYQEERGQASATMAALIADDDELGRALAAAGPTANAAPTALQRAAARAARHFARLTANQQASPDFMLLFDRSGRLIWQSPGIDFAADELGHLGAGFRIRNGLQVAGRVAVHGQRAYQLAGAPIRVDVAAPAPATPDVAPDQPVDQAAPPPTPEDVVGGIVLGTDINRYFERYEAMRNTWREGAYRLAMVADDQLVAANLSPDRYAALNAALQPDAWRYVADAERPRDHPRDAKTQPAVHFDDQVYYLISRDVPGFRGLDADTVGQLFLLRRQSNTERTGSRFPWTEVFIGLILSIVIASLLARWITRPIKRFVEQSQQIIEGETDLTQRIQLSSRDETRDLADNINQVFERLYELASEVQGAAFQVGASSAEISAASKEMAGGLKDQTLKIEGSTAAVTELSASIQQVAANAAEATQVAEKSNESVTSAVARMQEIRDAVEDAAEKMHELGESSKRIGNIVEVIRQISEQTSLLALNASIEAAHAGDQGRGFAVVADEVSSLARRVGQSAKDIEILIQTIREQTAEAVHSMQLGSREVDSGVNLVTTTLTDLTTLISVVRDTAGAVQEQAVVSDEIARNMDAVQTIATEMLAGSEESVAQSEQLHELAFQLEQSVGGFNLDARGGGGYHQRGPKRLSDGSGGAPTATSSRHVNRDKAPR